MSLDGRPTVDIMPAPLDIPAPPPGGGAPPPRGPPPITADMDILIDKSVYDVVEAVFNCGLINLVCMLGALGNVLNIYVLSKHGLQSSINIVLFSLAVADLLLLLTLPLRKISLIIAYFDEAYALTFEAYVICYQFLTLNRIWALISHTHVVIIAVERFLAVYFPFKVGQLVSPVKMKIITVCTHVSWYVLLTPMFTMFKLIWVRHPDLNATVAIPGISDFYFEHELAFNFYISFIVNLLTGGLQLIFVLSCSVAVAIKISKMGRKRQAMISSAPGVLSSIALGHTTSVRTLSSVVESQQGSFPKSDPSTNDKERDRVTAGQGDNADEEARDLTHKQPQEQPLGQTLEQSKGKPHVGSRSTSYLWGAKDEKSVSSSGHTRASTRVDLKVVRMLLVVCLVYLCFVFPTFFLYVFQYVFQEMKSPYWHRVNFVATSVHMLLLALNSATNFIVYVATSQKFYTTLKAIFVKRSK
ncbi:somatostatin receptor type 1-like [Aplysia californica]|uniref:Somatostatin receptor type 1-like n=1 Tax=Aplysia californica TaxID=6500 RepID=A0ABM0JA66_APLCA|nr:somatostatin receptor type 1-like [Aplysia californica]